MRRHLWHSGWDDARHCIRAVGADCRLAECTADPLRVLRAVRFASRFGFELEASLLEAAADDEVSPLPAALVRSLSGLQSGLVQAVAA